MTTVVFSKDRAMQLDAFLRSYARFVESTQHVDVLCLASSARHAAAYDQVFESYKFAHRRQQTTFRTDVLSLLPVGDRDNVIFFVDDIVFIRSWDGSGEPGLSLRLAPHLTYNYATGNTPQQVPVLESDGDRLTWKWGNGQGAWSYPLSVDGHVFNVAEMRKMLTSVLFSSPNTMESALQAFLFAFLERTGKCYRESKVVNVPWNRVQTDWHMLCGKGNDAEQMLAYWESGKQIDLNGIYGVLNESVHQEFPLKLESR